MGGTYLTWHNWPLEVTKGQQSRMSGQHEVCQRGGEWRPLESPMERKKELVNI